LGNQDCAGFRIGSTLTTVAARPSDGRANVDVTLDLAGYPASDVSTFDCVFKAGTTWTCNDLYVGNYVFPFFASSSELSRVSLVSGCVLSRCSIIALGRGQ
jgi:hypothetical protein